MDFGPLPHEQIRQIASHKTQSYDTLGGENTKKYDEEKEVPPFPFEHHSEWKNHEKVSSNVVRIAESTRTANIPPASRDRIGSTGEYIGSEGFYKGDECYEYS